MPEPAAPSPQAALQAMDRERRLLRAQRNLYSLGYAILGAGTVASGWVYRVATDDKASAALRAREQNTKQYEYQMEVYGGKSNLLAVEVQQWFMSLWHGTRLADTLAVLTFVLALGCFFVAHFLPEFPEAERAEPAGGEGT